MGIEARTACTRPSRRSVAPASCRRAGGILPPVVLRSGFTLIEVLLALAVIGIVLGAAHEFLASTVQRTDAVYADADGRTAAATLADVIGRDLDGIYPREGAVPTFVLTLPLGVAGSGMTLSFDTASPALDLPQDQAPDVRRVVYSLEPSQARPGRYLLYRAVVPFPAGLRDAGPGEVLADGLDKFGAAAFDGAQWLSEWPHGDAKGLPNAVRVTFERDGRQRSVTVAVDVTTPKPPGAAGGARP